MLTVNHDYSAMVTHNQINRSSNLLETAMQRMSTGLRINSAKDDAAGLQIATRLDFHSSGMKTAMKNSQDGISMLQVADGALDESLNIMTRMATLAEQSANGSNSVKDQTANAVEFDALRTELSEIVNKTKYAGDQLFTTNGIKQGGLSFQIGDGAGDIMSLSTIDAAIAKVFGDLDNTATGTGTGTATNKAFSGFDAATVATGDVLTNAQAASRVLTGLENAIDDVVAARSQIGAHMNRLDHNIANLGNMVENTDAASARIMDADFAVESSVSAKHQLLMQADTKALQHINELPQLAMALL